MTPQAGEGLAKWDLAGSDVYLSDRLRFTGETGADVITLGDAKIAATGTGVAAVVLSVNSDFASKPAETLNPGEPLLEFELFYRLTKNPSGPLPTLKPLAALKDTDPGNPICPFGFVVAA